MTGSGPARNRPTTAGSRPAEPGGISRRLQKTGRHRSARRVGRTLGVRRPEAGGVGCRLVGVEDSPADQSGAAARDGYGCRVRLHGSPRTARVAVARAPGRVGVRHPPGFDSDLIVRADLALFHRVWLGHIEYDAAVHCGSVIVEGLPVLAKQLPQWFMWSPMARFVREREHALAHGTGVFSNAGRRAAPRFLRSAPPRHSADSA